MVNGFVFSYAFFVLCFFPTMGKYDLIAKVR